MGMCEAAGEYQKNDSSRPLHHCDIYRSREAGRRFSEMLKLGNSVPWPDALEMLTGVRNISALPLREYFSPLENWLQEENQRRGNFVGWNIAPDMCVQRPRCVIPHGTGINSSSCPGNY